MIRIEDLYAGTDGGKLILQKYLPNFREDGKHFKIREEDAPSANAKCKNGHWRVTDWGADQEPHDALDIAMEHNKGKTQWEVINMLAAEFGIKDSWFSPTNTDIIKKRDATEEEIAAFLAYEKQVKESDKRKDAAVTYYTWKERELTDDFALVMVPRRDHINRTREKLAEYSWVCLEQYTMTRRTEDGFKTTEFNSTSTFPIYLRNCTYKDKQGKERSFQKIIKPYAPQKQYRFQHAGEKPPKWIHGLKELEAAWEKLNAENETDIPEEEGKKKRAAAAKIPKAVICCGDRDAMCCAAFGIHPLWFNSETYNSAITEAEIGHIMKMVDKLYYIPDLDKTGIKKAVELVERFPDIHIVWLPKSMQMIPDKRGNKRKDLWDWTDLHQDQAEFNKLVDMGMPFKFWQPYVEKDKLKYEINTAYYLNFLQCLGFGVYADEGKNQYVQVVDNIVEKFKDGSDIKSFTNQYLIEKGYKPEIRNVISNSSRTSESTYGQLQRVNLDFRRYGIAHQDFFFKNGVITVTADHIKPLRYPDYEHQVWASRIVPHDFKRLEPSFAIKKVDGGWDIDIKNKDSYFLQYLIQTSRVNWREELEVRAEQLPDAEREAYLQHHKVSIDGSLLSPDEIFEQKQHLISKIFAIGYLLHRYKFEDRRWIVYAMDDKISEISEANGRSGKSLFMEAIANLTCQVVFDGKDMNQIMANTHKFDQVTLDTDMILVDDADPYIDVKFLYNMVTGGITVNKKYSDTYTLSYQKSPKLAITTNYAPTKADASTLGRLLFVAFSDYYHEMSNYNNYRENRNPKSDLGVRLMDSEYPELCWNQDFNVMMDCLQFYLGTINDNVRINCPMEKIMTRMNKQIMGETFEEWANEYFSEEGENVNRLIVREKMQQDFYAANRSSKLASKGILTALQAFCKNRGYVFNPDGPWKKDEKGRFMKKVDGCTKQHFYIQTPGVEIMPAPDDGADSVPF